MLSVSSALDSSPTVASTARRDFGNTRSVLREDPLMILGQLRTLSASGCCLHLSCEESGVLHNVENKSKLALSLGVGVEAGMGQGTKTAH